MRPVHRPTSVSMGSNQAGKMVNKKSAGFTLIELMIVVLIVAVLLTVALPAYQDSVLRSNRSAARGILMNVLSREEQYFINNKVYTVNLSSIGLPAPYYIDNQAGQVANAADSIYEIKLINLSTFTGVQATPQNVQVKDDNCKTLTLSRTGAKTASGNFSSDPSQCW
jgi:type IV pilus assembly protein PilE